jgi:hypothetical protein
MSPPRTLVPMHIGKMVVPMRSTVAARSGNPRLLFIAGVDVVPRLVLPRPLLAELFEGLPDGVYIDLRRDIDHLFNGIDESSVCLSDDRCA